MKYRELKAKQKSERRNLTYLELMSETLIGMFDYTGFPDSVDTNFMEYLLMHRGICALCNIGDKWIVSEVDLIDDMDVYGYGKNAICHTVNGHEYTFKDWKENDKFVLVKNNSLMLDDVTNAEWYADMLTEIDVSMYANVIYSRYAPILRCNTETERLKIKKAYESIKNGEMCIIDTPNMDMVTGTQKGIDVINYTDVSNSDKLQYLSNFHNDILSRIYMLYGMDIQSTSKVSQYANVDEVNGKVTNSFIIPCNRLAEREKAIERFNALTGESVSVDFSKCWKMQLKTAPTGNDEEMEEGVEDETL